VDNDLALKIYIKARATPKVVAAFAERREFDKILIYSKQVCYLVLFILFSVVIIPHLSFKFCFYNFVPGWVHSRLSLPPPDHIAYRPTGDWLFKPNQSFIRHIRYFIVASLTL
jgi:hypothetical protein